MKKTKLLLLTAICVTTFVIVAGCGTKNASVTNDAPGATIDTNTPEATTPEATTPDATTPDATTVEAPTGESETGEHVLPEIEKLIKDNYECGIRILNGELPHENNGDYNENDESTYICKVTDDRFKTFDDFDKYVRSLYTGEVADKYLTGDKARYINKDGKLYINLKECGAKGYYVDWNDAKVTLDYVGVLECKFTVTGYLSEPGDNVKPEEYSVSGTVVREKEDGSWLLTEIIY